MYKKKFTNNFKLFNKFLDESIDHLNILSFGDCNLKNIQFGLLPINDRIFIFPESDECDSRTCMFL